MTGLKGFSPRVRKLIKDRALRAHELVQCEGCGVYTEFIDYHRCLKAVEKP